MADRRLVMFCHIEKCGGTTLIELMRSRLGITHVDLIPKDLQANVATARDLKATLRRVPFARSVSGHSLRPHIDYGPGVEKFTLLRDPVKRYVSEFRHDQERRHFTGTFEEWAALSSRWNHQTKFIAGEPCVDKAKRVLEDEVSFFGLTERYEDFIEVIATRLPELRGAPSSAANKSKGHAAITDRDLELAQERNKADIELVEFARALFQDRMLGWLKAVGRQRLMPGFGRRANIAFRNLYYKPSLGLMPFAPHSLPVNEVNAAVAEARGLDAHAAQGDTQPD